MKYIHDQHSYTTTIQYNSSRNTRSPSLHPRTNPTSPPSTAPLNPHPNDRPLQLAHAPTATKTPLLAHEPLIDPLAHDAASCPILHQAPRLLLAQPAHAPHLHAALFEDAEDPRVVGGEGVFLHGGIAFELGEGEGQRGDGGAVGFGGGGEDEACVWEGGFAGEVREEPVDEGELVRVDGLVGVGYVVGVSHRVREAVHAEQ